MLYSLNFEKYLDSMKHRTLLNDKVVRFLTKQLIVTNKGRYDSF